MDQASKMLLWPRTIKKPRIKGLQNHRFQVVCISTLSISNTFWLMVLQMCFRRNPILISRYLEMRWQLGVSIPPNSFGYGSIPINTIFLGMNIHLPAILMFTRGTRFWHTAISSQVCIQRYRSAQLYGCSKGVRRCRQSLVSRKAADVQQCCLQLCVAKQWLRCSWSSSTVPEWWRVHTESQWFLCGLGSTPHGFKRASTTERWKTNTAKQ